MSGATLTSFFIEVLRHDRYKRFRIHASELYKLSLKRYRGVQKSIESIVVWRYLETLVFPGVELRSPQIDYRIQFVYRLLPPPTSPSHDASVSRRVFPSINKDFIGKPDHGTTDHIQFGYTDFGSL